MDMHTAGVPQDGASGGYLSIQEAAAGLAPIGAATPAPPPEEEENTAGSDPAQAEADRREAPQRAQEAGDRQEAGADEEREMAEGPEGDEAEAGAEAAAGDDLDPDMEIEVTLPGGSKSAVTLSELVRGYSREADYTRKTAELADERRQLQDWARGAQQRVNQAVAERLQFLDSLGAFEMPEPPSPELVRQDPDAYLERQADYDAAMRRIATAQQVRNDLRAQHEQQQKVRLDEENRLLASKWAGLTKETFATMVNSTMEAYGFTPQEMELLSDHRLALALRDAQRYRDMMAKAGKARPAPTPVRRVAKPGSSTTQRDRARDLQGRYMRALDGARTVAEQIDLAARNLKPLE